MEIRRMTRERLGDTGCYSQTLRENVA